jgi:hypothetical protein
MSRRPATGRLAAIAMRKMRPEENPTNPRTPGNSWNRNTPRTPPGHPNNNFRNRVLGGVQAMENNFQKMKENKRITDNIGRKYVNKLKVKVLVARVKRRVPALFNHYGIRNANNIRILMPKVSEFVIKYVGKMRNTNNANNEAGVRRLIYEINRSVPARFHTTKQSRFKKLFRPNKITNQRRTPWQQMAHVGPNVAMGLGKLVRAFV